VTAVVIKGPVQLADQALEGFRTTPPVTSRDSDRRLLTLSGSWRADYWTVAWSMVEREPLFGEGGGSFERWWLQKRPVASYARDAHNLYLETLAELGPAGLALLVTALAVPLAALRRVSRRPLTAAAAAAYVAFLVHAGLDWDWEVPLVTLPALAFAASLVVLARGDAGEELSRSWRALGAVAGAAIVLVSLVVHVGNRAVGAAEEALANGVPAAADDRARRARGWMPWAAHPWQLLGEAQLSARRDVRARTSLAEAVQRDPERWSAWYSLAVAAHGRARAIALARAEELNPLSPEIADLRRELQTDS
jgi:O-Antigen ligase